MKIYLFLIDRLHEFNLSKKVFGSFSFDPNIDEESKLINVEAKDGQWVLYSTEDVKVMFLGAAYNTVILENNKFYTLLRNNAQYLIYVSNIEFTKVGLYTYASNINLNIGYSNESNIKYQCEYLKNKNINISCQQGKLILNNPQNAAIYIDKKYCTLTNFEISFGSELFIYGLDIVILNGVLLIKNNYLLSINIASACISNYNLPFLGQFENIPIKDVDLYKPDDYFSKSPRLKRTIKTKKIKLTESPSISEYNGDKLSMIFTLGPMLTMGLVSIVNFSSTISRIQRGEVSLQDSKIELLTQGAMLLSMLGWPLLTNLYNKIKSKSDKKKLIKKYKQYLSRKQVILEEEKNTQKSILIENLTSVENCAKIVLNKKSNFWDKRLDQSDLLEVRVGLGNEELDVEIEYPEKEDFDTGKSQLQIAADNLIQQYKYIDNVPIRYSFSKNRITAIMGTNEYCQKFMSNMLLQLLTYYSYEDLKIVTFTSPQNKDNWDYLKYFNHSFSNEKDIRYFATNNEQAKKICEKLNLELSDRIEKSKNKSIFTPYYFIVIDNYDMVKRFEFIKRITELNENVGFSMVILENKMSKLPSKCNNFISLTATDSSILIDAFETQRIKKFTSELDNNVNMYEIARSLSNVPIYFADGIKVLPESITFLEMEKIGKVEQLNILNRWEKNDATQSLKAEVGVDEQGELMYLDLHEKFHGPHGLIAGTTGSGKSEFIITYILSLAVNYSPEDVAFILIDYKGGGLAFAFENKISGKVLPHLAGTITNLDKAEMNRTLVSIDSEVKRRQRVFNEARDKCGESTIDIYKYQKLYKDGKLDEPLPHLFIICDEFAELKSQQPEFMDNLISVARIGRSLGVHLILATQKPSGVVNDQIWSNTKFRVCLKVQDEGDSREMLKRPEAAMIKQAGRFYLQVGMDEIFALGQSGWCGAKYFPSDKPIKQVDKSLDFIDETGFVFKSAESTSEKALGEAQGEQLAAIMNNIIETSVQTNKRARKLWLENIPNIILAKDLYEKYKYTRDKNLFEIIFGEYDAPESQTQGAATYNLLKDGNLILYGSDGSEKEFFLSSFIYSATILHNPEDINIYIVDYGSESLRRFQKLPHMGDMVFVGESEKYQNLIKMIQNEIFERKKLFSDYGGQYSNYINNSGKKLPLKIIIINNFESLLEEHPEIYDLYSELLRDSDRYGIIFIFTASALNSIPSKISQNFTKCIAFKMKDSSDYQSIFDMRCNITLKNSIGRGILKHNLLHEFQTLSIVKDSNELNKYMISYIEQENKKYQVKADGIPKLPEVITFEHIKNHIDNLSNVPLGIYRQELSVAKYDFLLNVGTIITSNKIANTIDFTQNLVQLFSNYNMNTMVIDGQKKLKITSSNKINYYNDNYDLVFQKIIEYVEQVISNNSNVNTAIIIYGINKLISKMDDSYLLDSLASLLKKYEKIPLIIIDDSKQIKEYSYENWFSTLFSTSEGIWIGKGVGDQQVFPMSVYDKSLQAEIPNNMGYIISDGYPALVKFIELDKDNSNNQTVDK